MLRRELSRGITTERSKAKISLQVDEWKVRKLKDFGRLDHLLLLRFQFTSEVQVAA
jgi:hypothetical protein